MCLDRLDEAKKVAETVRIQGIDGARIHQRFLEIGYIEDDQAAITKETLWYAVCPSFPDWESHSLIQGRLINLLEARLVIAPVPA